MRLRQIEVFHAVYATGSVSGGARALNVSQPTVSKVLRHTEDQLGFALFDRISGRLIPTKKGTALFTEVEPLFGQLNDLSRFTARLATLKTGQLRFAMTPAFGLELAPKALAQFAKAHPDVTIEIETLHANQVVKALTDSEIDIGLVFDAPNFPGIQAKQIGQTEFICVAPKDMKWPQSAHETPALRLEDLESLRLITLNEKSVLGQLLHRKLEGSFSKPVDSRIIVETYHVAKRLVKEGAGIAIIDSITAYSGDNSGLAFKKIVPAINISVDVVTRVNEPMARIREAFVESLSAAMTAFDEKIRN
jgi:DNA-binding transcriptional LysR family regulator